MKDFFVRPARPSDRDPVLAFCEHTWAEHGDYIADVWDKWMADQEGHFLVGELAGQPVAIGKITVLRPGEIWLEGMRVAPELRGQGIAMAFMEQQQPYLAQTRPHVIRLATSSNNIAIHHIMSKRGFQHVATFEHVRASAARRETTPAPDPLSRADAPSIEEILNRSASFASAHRLYARGWQWAELPPERLEAHLQAGEVFGYRRDDGIVAAFAILLHSLAESSRLWMGLIDGDPDVVVRLAQALRGQAAATSEQEVAGFVPAHSIWPATLEQAGYQREKDMSFWIFERRGEQ
ncbi:MAG: GNAT family N-acetyltransferase [Chloroflexi bacterium]|nr:GNAT family N-acetyltransferase [Chloroflexota bacterium]